jgi:XTP/dITP diphosphohydrolase
VVLASANPHKVAELAALLGDRFEVVPRPADAPATIEDADSLEGNAIKKAFEIARFCGDAAIADDTGLFVAALDGRPGVRSARYAGDAATDADNVAKLLGELDGVDDRRAEFRTVVALIHPDGTGVTGEGSIPGHITDSPRGTYGFGYDPIFEADEAEGLTFAEMPSEAKNDLSHRSRALVSLRLALDRR